MLENSLQALNEEPAFWKWAIFSTHNAVQGACVCFLTRTDGVGALDRKSETALLEYHNLRSQKAINEKTGGAWILGEPTYPEVRVENFLGLLRRLPEKWKAEIPNKPDVLATGSRNIAFQRLHRFRNMFTHFEPMGLSLEIEGLPLIVKEALLLTEQIVVSQGYKRWNRFNDMEIEPTILRCKSLLKGMTTS